MTNARSAIKASILVLAITLDFSGCTNVSVKPVATETRLTEVLIQENPKVQVEDFLPVLTDGFKRHGITVKVVPASADTKDAYVVTYVAYNAWDFGSYLCDATITLSKNGRKIGQALYHLKAGGGFAPNKWSGTKSKIDPVIDELLKDYLLVH